MRLYQRSADRRPDPPPLATDDRATLAEVASIDLLHAILERIVSEAGRSMASFIAADEAKLALWRAQVAEVRAESADALTGYYDAVRARTTQFLADIEPAGLDRVVDTRWDPPVTLGVRLVSIADDCIQHVGQAAYVRGLLDRA